MAYRTVGPQTRDEINPTRIRHDMRRWGERFNDAVAKAEISAGIFFGLVLVALFIPAFADVALAVGGIFYFLIKKAQNRFALPIKLPRQSGRVDPHELHPGKGTPVGAMGTFYLGNDRQTGAEVWLSNRDAGVHMLVLGTTGSGKTELLLGLCQNALNLGSGFMFVDGKAQDKIAFKIMDLVRARGRDDDFLCLNFITGAKDIIGPQATKSTNSMNPFSYGSASMISQIVVGLMSSGAGGDDMWKDRAISFVEAISPPLTYLRDHFGVMLDVNKYRQYFELDRLEELAWKGAEMYPGLGQVLEGLQNYLLNLPAYDKNKYGKKGQAEDTKLQHGFITMQLVRAFTSLADTYGHIVRVPLGETFFPDLVKNRRILVVMLPSLEKTPSETANLGKIIVTALRNIMAESLGAKLEGDRKSLENEEGRKLLAPYVVILDEYGYYAVKGFAVAFAQARSLGFVCVVGGQDLASFQKESKEESVSICGNTRIKLFGSIEDPGETMKFAVDTGGKAMVAKASQFEFDAGMFSPSFSDQNNVNFDVTDRIDPSDIKVQKEGEFTIVWGPYVIRTKTYFVDPVQVSKVRLNHFVGVHPPTKQQLNEIDVAVSGLLRRISAGNLTESVQAEEIEEISAAAVGLAESKAGGMGVLDQGICSLLSVGIEREIQRKRFTAAVETRGRSQHTPDAYRQITSLHKPVADPMAVDYSAVFETMRVDPAGGDPEGPDDDGAGGYQAPQASRSSADFAPSLSPEDAVPMARDPLAPPEKMSVFVPRKKSGFADEVFAGSPDSARSYADAIGAGDDVSLLDYNKTYKGLQEIRRALGSSDEEADAAARATVKTMEDATRYPQSVPKEKSGDEVEDLLKGAISALEDVEDT